MPTLAANRIRLCLGDVIFQFAAEDPATRLALPAEYAPFLMPVSRARPDARYAVSRRRAMPAPAERPGPLWASETVRLWQAPQGRVGIDYFQAVEKRWRCAGHLSPDLSGGALHPAPRAGRTVPVLPLYYPHDRIVIMGRLAGAGAGLLHAAAVEDAGRGLVFAGRSGSGKTTLARLWRRAGATLLNDERVILRRHGRRNVRVSATPWHGAESATCVKPAPLAAIFFIRQAPRNRVRRLGPAACAARLLTASVLPVFLADGVARLTRTWAETAAAVPAYELEFTPDAGAVACVRAELKTA